MIETIISPINSEYFCWNCGQLRASDKTHPNKCGNCGSKNIVCGKVGELDKNELKKEFRNLPEWKRKLLSIQK